MDDAFRLLTNLKKIKDVDITPPPFNALLTRILVFKKEDIFVNAGRIIALMRQMDVKPCPITCTNYLTVCAECGQFNAAKQFLLGEDDAPSIMSEFGLIPNIKNCNAYLTVCAKTGQFKAAKRFLLSGGNDNMRKRWPQAHPLITPDSITCLNYLTVCAECGQFDAAKQFLLGEDDAPSIMSGFGLIPDIAICSAYLTVCAKLKRFDEAEHFVQQIMPKWNLKANHVVHALFSVVDTSHFERLINDGIKNQIYRQCIGLHGTQLNLHMREVFKLESSLEVYDGVPLEFAKQLFRYLFIRRSVKIERVITGFHLGTKLRNEFSKFLLEEFNITTTLDESNLGVLVLKNESSSIN